VVQSGLLDRVASERGGAFSFHGAAPIIDVVNQVRWRGTLVVTTSKSPKLPRIQALARASAIIDVIAAGGAEGVGLSEISRATALNKTTAFNLLASLVTLRFIEQDEDSRWYRLGLRNIELGRIVQQRLHIPSLARPMLMDLCNKTNETVSLALPDLLDVFVVDSIGGSHFLHVAANPGSRSMYHCTALGKAVLAQWDEPMRRTVYRKCGLPRRTPHTITDVDTLEAQLLEILARGYALDAEENAVGVTCISASISNGFGDVAAAISVTGPSNRMTADALDQFAMDVIAAANAITAAIGCGERPDNRACRKRR
jgi:DNA-binding IclR family transcriptional regulator